VLLSPDNDDDLVVPFVTEPAGWTLADIMAKCLPNFCAHNLTVW
jgi:hypothetical protein